MSKCPGLGATSRPGAPPRAILEPLGGQPGPRELAISPREAQVPTAAPALGAGEQGPPGRAPAPASAPEAPKSRLNSMLNFDSLVEGSANRMARAAAMHVATTPGHLYNPLFIYGGVGLGKTHLMHAAGNRLLADRPMAKVLYIHAEQFVSDVVKSYQRKTFDEFKDKYHSLDLLLIDDVQFFANKERTQEEFFNAFEALLAKKSHIVMTSDTYPKGLTDIHERLVSRFDSGLTVAIEPPELEMRVAILINKARAEGADMPEEVAFFIAKNVRSTCASSRGRYANAWPIPALTKRTSPFFWPAKPCATCCRFKTGRSLWKTSKKRWPITTKSRSPTCIPRSARPASPGHAKLPCTWPKS